MGEKNFHEKRKKMKLKIGIFQYKMQDESPNDKISRLGTHLKNHSKIDVVICPELFLSGYGNQEKIYQFSESYAGDYATKISSLAKKYGTSIIYGYPEIHERRIFNSAQFFNQNGQSIANHRKTLLPPTADESKIFTQGAVSTLISIKGIKTAIVICYELEFPELIRDLALQDVKLIIAPTGQSSLWPAAARYNCRTRAFENGIFVAYANSTGRINGIDFMGESKIIGPDGIDLVNADQGEKIISAEIDTKDIKLVREKLPYLHDSKSYK